MSDAEGMVLGFHALNAHAVDYAELPADMLAPGQGIGQIPAAYISMIGVDERHQSKGYGDEPRMTALVRNARIFHLHACTLGASYAVKHGVTSLRWKKVMTYAWS